MKARPAKAASKTAKNLINNLLFISSFEMQKYAKIQKHLIFLIYIFRNFCGYAVIIFSTGDCIQY
jgi:hypothetical protein